MASTYSALTHQAQIDQNYLAPEEKNSCSYFTAKLNGFGCLKLIMKKSPKLSCISATIIVILLILSSNILATVQGKVIDTGNPLEKEVGIISLNPRPCYGPCIIANISKTQANIGETIFVTGKICLPANNLTIRIAFTRPDYTWIDQQVITDNVTGEFAANQTLDMIGFWNIFPIYGHINDRLYVNVTDPLNPMATPPAIRPLPAFRLNHIVIIVGIIAAIITIIGVIFGIKVKTRKISSTRLFVQVAIIFLLFFGAFIDHQNIPVPAEQIAPHEFLIGANSLSIMPDGLPLPVFGCYYGCGRTFTCPLWQIQTYIYPFWTTGRGWGVNYDISGLERIGIVIGVVIVASVLLGRFWCGWICPFGLYMDLMTRLRKALRIRHRDFSPKFNEKFHQLAYVILALIIILSIIFASQAIAGTQLIPGTEKGGFVYTYFSAPFCQVCPMKPLCILLETSVGLMQPSWVFGPTTGQFWQLGQYITSINLLVFALVTATAFFFRRSWCRICPLGGLIGLFNRFQPFKSISGVRIEKTEEKCTKCGVCKRVCPTQVTEVYEKKSGDVTTSQCLLCLRCVEMCPEKDCLKFKVAGKTVCKSRNWLQ